MDRLTDPAPEPVSDALLRFVRLLRKNGVRVSTAETLDAFQAAAEVGLRDGGLLGEALRATLVKRASDEVVFDELYALCFLGRGELDVDMGAAPLAEELAARGLSEDEIEVLLALLADEAARLSPTARLGLGLRRGAEKDRVGELLRRSGVQIDLERLTNPLQVGFFTQQVLEALEVRHAEEELSRLAAGLSRKLGPERAAELAEVLRGRLGKLRQAVRRHVEGELQQRTVSATPLGLEHKPFAQMDRDELRRLRDEVDRLAWRLRAARSLRPKHRRLGRLDARRTLRKSLATGGVPFRVERRLRRVDKPRLAVLCDISDSVRNVSRFMLQLAYTLQDRFEQVRSFVFVAELGEVTRLFAEHPIERATELAYGGAAVNVYANSNFGRAFRDFRERHLDAVTPRTTVLVIGDGRNNYQPPEAWALADVRARARRVLWLNPEPRMSWSFGDSAMRAYEPHCDRVETVANLASLRRVIDSIF